MGRVFSRSRRRWTTAPTRCSHAASGSRRLSASARPTRGWAGLTESEPLVVRLVGEGLTDRETAARLYLSPHTVSMHLRHAFSKLGINSRVELARIVLEHDRDGN